MPNNNKPSSVQFKPLAKHGRSPAATSTTSKQLARATPTTKLSTPWHHVPEPDSFSSYMHHKNRKLRKQFAAEFSTSPTSDPATNIFAGVVVWVNGHTDPSRLHIRRIMGHHGGRLETYYTTRVTHVVAANLATATRLRFSNNSSTAPRVKLVSPQWISASLARGRRLPETDYPIPLMTSPTQRSISSFFTPKTSQDEKTSISRPRKSK